jgi:hypothetical protein
MNLFKKFWEWHSKRPCDKVIGPGHNFVDLHDGRKFEEFQPTGEYINGEPITKKYYVKISKCTRCGETNRERFRAIY